MKSFVINRKSLQRATDGNAFETLKGWAFIGDSESAHQWTFPSAERVRRLKQELEVIESAGLTCFFDLLGIIGRSAREHQFMVAIRGAAGGSMLLHALGLTHACPVRFGLLGELSTGALTGNPANICIYAETSATDRIVDLLQSALNGREFIIKSDSPFAHFSDAELCIRIIDDDSMDALGFCMRENSERRETRAQSAQIPLTDQNILCRLTSDLVKNEIECELDFRDDKSPSPILFEDIVRLVAISKRPDACEFLRRHDLRDKDSRQSERIVPSDALYFHEQAIQLLHDYASLTYLDAWSLLKASIVEGKNTLLQFRNEFIHSAGREIGLESATEMFETLVNDQHHLTFKTDAANQAIRRYWLKYLAVDRPHGFPQNEEEKQ